MSSKPGPKMSDPTHQDVLQFVHRNSAPFVTTNDVAEEFEDVTRKTVISRLHDLADEGELDRRKVGAAAKVWYIPN